MHHHILEYPTFINLTTNQTISVSAEEPIDNIKLLTVEKVLDLIESAYPNPITIQDVAK